MMRLPWQRWEKPPPPDPEGLAESFEMLDEVDRRRVATIEALARRRAVILHNHIARDVSRAIRRHPA